MTQQPQEQEQRALLPCPNPWCHSLERDFPLHVLGIAETPIIYGRIGYRVRCSDCGLHGPTVEKKADAYNAWNTRIANSERLAPSGDGLAGQLRTLHDAARGREFDLTPADGPIAQLALFMHENGEAVIAALSAPSAGEGAVERKALEKIKREASYGSKDAAGYSTDRFARIASIAATALTPTTGDTPATREEGREG